MSIIIYFKELQKRALEKNMQIKSIKTKVIKKAPPLSSSLVKRKKQTTNRLISNDENRNTEPTA